MRPRTPGVNFAYTGIRAGFRPNWSKGVDAYVTGAGLGRPGHWLYLFDDHPGCRPGVFSFRGAEAPLPKNHAGLCRWGHDGGVGVELTPARYQPGCGGRRFSRLAARGRGNAAGGQLSGSTGQSPAPPAAERPPGGQPPECPADDGHHFT